MPNVFAFAAESFAPSPRKAAIRTGALAAALGVVSWCSSVPAADSAVRPNVVLIMADDLGYETIGANGGTSYPTPVLDQLAATGVRFTRCCVQPLCTPTRVQLMTGQYNIRNYTAFGVMDPGLKTFGNLFRDAGYATCIAGKWQLGRELDLPGKFGFDEACLWQHLRRPERYRNPGLEVNGKEVDYTEGEYGPELVNDYALDFIERHKSESFFLYYPMILTHGPFDPTPDSPDYGLPKRERRPAQNGNPHFGEMVTYMDKMIGRVIERLEALGLRERTLVIFLGDNGTGRGIRSRMGDRVVVGGKGEPNASGMHVPLIASWPGTIASGQVCDDLVDSTDFLPTVCEAAGVPVPGDWTLDGRSFLAQLRGERGQPRRWYYCWYAPRGVLQADFAADKRFKLHRSGKFFDLRHDPEETEPLEGDALNAEAADARAALQQVLDRYQDARPAELPQPEVGPRRARRGAGR